MNAPIETPVVRERPFIEPGWYRDLTNEQYHGSFGTSSTRLKVLLDQTPAHLMYQMTHPNDPTANMMLGTAVHALVLEPDTVADHIAVLPELNKRTNAGKAEFEHFLEMNQGKTIITPAQWDQANAMAASVLNCPEAAAMLEDTIRESSVYWWYNSRDPDDNTEYREMLKVRPDAISRNHPVLVDLKSCADATFTGFSQAIHRFGYHVSAAMYLEGVSQCKPLLEELRHFAYSQFVFIAVESEPPYLTAVYELDPDSLALGRQMLQHALRTLHRARAAKFPGFEGIRMISLPSWANRMHVV